MANNESLPKLGTIDELLEDIRQAGFSALVLGKGYMLDDIVRIKLRNYLALQNAHTVEQVKVRITELMEDLQNGVKPNERGLPLS